MLLTAAGLSAQSPSYNDPAIRDAARELGARGIEAFLSHEHSVAAQRLDSAYLLYPTPTLGLWSARARAELGNWVEAAERYRETARASPLVGDNAAQRKAQQDAEIELAALSRRIPLVKVQLHNAAAADVTLVIDEREVSAAGFRDGWPLNPGTHKLLVARGAERHEVIVELAAEQQLEVPVQLSAMAASAVGEGPGEGVAAAPSAPAGAASIAVTAAGAQAPDLRLHDTAGAADAGDSGGIPLWSAAAVSLGAAALLTSGVAALAASHHLEDCSDRAGQRWCPDEVADAYDRARTVTAVSLYCGLALSTAGLLGWWLTPGAGKPAQLAVQLHLSGVDVTGAF